MIKQRKSWDEYFLSIAEVVSEHSTCDRKHVGAIIVKDKRLVCTGYNGSIPGQPHCDDPEEYWACNYCKYKTKMSPTLQTLQLSGRGYVCIRCNVGSFAIHTGGHDMEDNHCIRTIHAEVNAISQAARLGVAIEGATLFCNTLPCWNCFKTIVAAGICEVVYKNDYASTHAGRVKEASKEIPGFTLRRYVPGSD